MSEYSRNEIIIGGNKFYRIDDDEFVNISKITSIKFLSVKDSCGIERNGVRFEIGDGIQKIYEIWSDQDSFIRIFSYFQLYILFEE